MSIPEESDPFVLVVGLTSSIVCLTTIFVAFSRSPGTFVTAMLHDLALKVDW